MAKKKRKVKKLIITLSIVAVVAVAGVIFIPRFIQSKNAKTAAVMATATVTKGDIATTVVGTGNIAYDDSMEVKIPDGIKIDEVKVSSGDTVKKGDTLATIDADSLQSLIAETESKISTLDAAIESSDDGSKYIKATVAGRVKEINTAAGDNVATVASDKGSLMTLSLDGTMSVDVETKTELSAGDTVTVTLSDGTTETGTVKSYSSGKCTVTITDNGPKVGDKVTVKTSDGTSVGSGKLYITRPLEVIATSGTVSSVNVDLNDSVTASTKLITLTKAATTSEYEQNYSDRETQKAILDELLTLAKTNSIVADFTGTIEDVNIADGTTGSSSSSSSSNSSSSGTSATNMAATDSDSAFTVSLLANTAAATSSKSIVEISDISNLSITAPVTGATPQTTIAEDTSYTGLVTWSPSASTFAGETSYTATVMLTAKSGYKFASGTTPVSTDGVVGNVSLSSNNEGNILAFTITYPATTAAATASASASASATPEATATPAPSSSATSGAASGGAAKSGGSVSVSGGSGSSTATTSTSSTNSSDSSDNDEITAFTAVVSDNVKLDVSIDELDILSVKEGQTASITLDAVDGKTFTGTITSVAEAASSSNNVATYAVEITLPKDDNIKIGMSASATITVSESKDTLLLPMNALQEDKQGEYVYLVSTSGSETGGTKTYVETGISDGTNVEITSGLSEGDTVAYTVETDDSSSSSSSNSNTMNIGGLTGGGGGGQMPSGGGPQGGGPQGNKG